MSEESKEVEVAKESQTLGLNEAKNMTIGEAVRKDSEIKAGITEDDSILDKYIKQHRDEVSSQKFDAKYVELDTASLDNFIKKQREELSKSGLVDAESSLLERELDEPLVEAVQEEWSPMEEAVAVTASVPVETMVPVGVSIEEVTSEPETAQLEPTREYFSTDQRLAELKPKKKTRLLVGLLTLLLVVPTVILGLIYLKPESAKTTKTTTSSKTASSDKSSQLKAKSKAFEKQYADFFADTAKSKLKNSEFAKLSELEATLKALKGSAYYDKAKEKVDALKKAITAIAAVNGKFVSDVIVNGEKVAAEVKANANFDDLASTTVTTGNADLDSLIQSSITDGRQQLATKAEATRVASEQAAVQQAPASQATQTPSTTVSPLSIYGITTYDSSLLQRNLSRVPYNQGVIADSGNPSWTFNPGVLEKIVATSQARGYISGNQYILEPVNIINGNGYYNMFKPDGTYLFSLNCKTGYFVGNGKGYADALDY
ncbi:cell division site-positioning protein MapZ family protein [Streptococcus castoreus]|uniref:cell division site-positioning protein MapZ family protein n=1 Tax=Streptococcus castoreus TaxID=254786 RepID=UPI000419A208|nr:cell division site-positioning protein MapZ family protein [Streptococcus castoreus]